MTVSSKLEPDEERLVNYFATRIVMPFGEAQDLRTRIAARYDFQDTRLTYFGQELRRRSGLSKSDPSPFNAGDHELSKCQLEFLRRAVACISPGLDLGETKQITRAVNSEQVAPNSRTPADLKSLIQCYSCKSAEGKPKKIYRSRLAAEQAAREAGRVFEKEYGVYVCLVQTNWWHLRTVKPPVSPPEPTEPTPPSDAAIATVEASPPPKVLVWTPDSAPETYELNLCKVTARSALDPTTELNQRVQRFLISKMQAEIIRTMYRWIHIDALESVIDAKTAVIYSPDYVHISPHEIYLKFGISELHIANKHISWR